MSGVLWTPIVEARLSVDIVAMSDLDHEDGEFSVIDLIDDAMIAEDIGRR